MWDRAPVRMQRLVASLLLAGIAYVGIKGDLSYYIHPRYELFTITLSLVGSGVLLMSAIFYKHKGEPTDLSYSNLELPFIFCAWLLSKGVWLVLLTFVLLVFLPAKPLMSEVAGKKRSQDYWSDYEDLRYISWAKDPKSINQIVGLANRKDTQDLVLERELELTGFIQRTPDNSPEILLLSRFVISCCAVDANPVSLAVYAPDWEQKYKEDDWVQVKGILKQGKKLGVDGAVLESQNSKLISEPEVPYEYLMYE